MTLSSLNKLREREGVTLVELLVVILIVAILAVGLLPTFKKLIVEAQYSNEPMSTIGSLRTQISLYMYEHNKVPCDNDKTDPYAYVFKKNDSGVYQAMKYKIDKANMNMHANGVGTPMPSTENHWLSKLDLSIDQLQGNRLTPDQVHFACTANGGSWCYALGVFGTGEDNALPANTGYAVMEANFGSVKVEDGSNSKDAADKTGYHILATWKNYDGNGTTLAPNGQPPIQISFSIAPAPSCCALLDDTALGSSVVTIQDAEAKLALLNKASGGKVCGKWTYPVTK